MKQLLRFYEFKNILDLPENHTLNQLDRIYFEEKYNLNLFDEELPMCVVVPSHNNVQYGRYKRILQSIFYQNYTNYHIVFIDDFSTDQTLNKSIEYAKLYGFPGDRIEFIRN